jgi:hypothetical protein
MALSGYWAGLQLCGQAVVVGVGVVSLQLSAWSAAGGLTVAVFDDGNVTHDGQSEFYGCWTVNTTPRPKGVVPPSIRP